MDSKISSMRTDQSYRILQQPFDSQLCYHVIIRLDSRNSSGEEGNYVTWNLMWQADILYLMEWYLSKPLLAAREIIILLTMIWQSYIASLLGCCIAYNTYLVRHIWPFLSFNFVRPQIESKSNKHISLFFLLRDLICTTPQCLQNGCSSYNVLANNINGVMSKFDLSWKQRQSLSSVGHLLMTN